MPRHSGHWKDLSPSSPRVGTRGHGFAGEALDAESLRARGQEQALQVGTSGQVCPLVELAQLVSLETVSTQPPQPRKPIMAFVTSRVDIKTPDKDGSHHALPTWAGSPAIAAAILGKDGRPSRTGAAEGAWRTFAL